MMLAVTGGIGAGKSTVLNLFAGFGARVADADDVAHSLYRQGMPAYQQIVGRWGREILDADGDSWKYIFPVASAGGDTV